MDGTLRRKDFTGFDYHVITVNKSMQSVYTDSFGSFGWIAEGMMRRSQEETERDKSTKEEYRDKLDEIDKKISTFNSSYSKKKDRDETIGKQQEVLRAMRNLKEFQDEQSRRLAKKARQAAIEMPLAACCVWK